MSKCHVFSVDDAVKYGMEKAVILYNLRFWLDKVKANDKERSKHEGYYWTFNSVTAFKELFPYLSEGQLQRHLKGLEKDGVILAGVFNQKGYDRTKWYSMPEFKIDNSVRQNQKVHSLYLTNDFVENNEPIPDVNAYVSADVISNTCANDKRSQEISFEEFWNAYDYKKGGIQKPKAKWLSFSFEQQQLIMNHVPEYVKSTPVKKYRKHPMTYLNNEGWLDEIDQPQQTNNQVVNYAKQPIRSAADEFGDMLEQQLAAEQGERHERTVN